MGNRLTNIGIRNAADGTLLDGDGLQLVKRGERGKWVFRYSHAGKRREMGLGPWPLIGLAEARRARTEWMVELLAGRDPITVRNARRADDAAERERADPTLASVVRTVFEARRDSLRGDGTRGGWLDQLELYVLPKIGKVPVSTLTRHDIADALRPIWRKKHPSADKALQRIRTVLTEAAEMGTNCKPFEAQAARRILGAVRYEVTHTPSTPWPDIPRLYQRLTDSAVDDCLRFMMLTCVRSHGCREARFDEIEGDVWTVPKDRVKGTEQDARDFRVPLSAAALRLVESRRALGGPWLFSHLGTRPVSVNALPHRMTALKERGRPHGFRASFRSWAQDARPCDFEVSEMVLGHSLGNAVSRAYARSDLLELRRPVMEAWARHLTGEAVAPNVVNLTRKATA